MLDELNTLLEDRDLDLPFHKRQVSRSGNNLAWLKKHAAKRNQISVRLKQLLDMPIQQLVAQQ